jgi:beta-barrel assembly-enhancing protease
MVVARSPRISKYGPKLSGILLATLLMSLTPFVETAQAVEPRPERPFYNHFTAEDEARLGLVLSNKIETEGLPVPGADGGQQILRVKRNSLVEAYLDGIASKLSQASQQPEIHYSVRILDAPGVVNAFSIPGGHIYVSSGLLDFVENESELAAVLAHEVGHVVAGHASNRIARVNIFGMMLDQARDIGLISDSATAQKLADVAFPVLFAVDAHTFYSRDDEVEADLLGLYEMVRAGWNPGGETAVLGRLAKGSQGESGIAALIATHPNPSDRLLNVQNEIESAKFASGLRRDSADFAKMRRTLHETNNDASSSQLSHFVGALVALVVFFCVSASYFRKRRTA